MLISSTTIGIGFGIIGLEFYRFGIVCDGTVKIVFVEVSSTTIEIDFGNKIGFQVYCFGEIFEARSSSPLMI